MQAALRAPATFDPATEDRTLRLGFGMSWGATVAGAFAAESGAHVAKLVLVTPLWLSRTPLRFDPGDPLRAYRVVNVKAVETGWRIAAPEPKRQALIPEGWFATWEQATLATDPGAPTAGTIRAPAGAVQDVREHWTADNPLYDPTAIQSPALVIAAEWDIDVPIDMAHGLFARLTNATYKRLVEIGEETHMVLMEKNRCQAFDAVVGFLNERFEPNP
jgi:pimeloyl-ACP methyl ester carboxylesterase